jgi:hypothetical protein
MRLQCEGEEKRRVNWKVLYRKFYFLHAPVLYDYTRERIRQWEQAMETQDDRYRVGGDESAGYMRAGEGMQVMMEDRCRTGEGVQMIRCRADEVMQVMMEGRCRVEESAQVIMEDRLTQQEKDCAIAGRSMVEVEEMHGTVWSGTWPWTQLSLVAHHTLPAAIPTSSLHRSLNTTNQMIASTSPIIPIIRQQDAWNVLEPVYVTDEWPLVVATCGWKVHWKARKWT